MGAGALRLAEFLGQPATAPELISRSSTTTRPTMTPDTLTPLCKAELEKAREQNAALIDSVNVRFASKIVKSVL